MLEQHTESRRIPVSGFRFQVSQQASSLITTLLVLVVLSTVVVAFMQSMSVERNVARSYRNRLQVDLAIVAGKNAAIQAMESITQNDAFIVVKNGNYTYLGTTTNAENSIISYVPGFSTVTNSDQLSLPTPFSTTTTPSIIPFGSFPSNQVQIHPFNDTSRVVATTLVNLPDDKGKIKARYAYWIEDLGSKVNASVSGNLLSSSLSHARASGTNLNEIALYTLFSSNTPLDIGDTNSKSIINNRTNIISSLSYLQVVTNVTNDVKDELAFNVPTVSDLEVVPYGFGYTNHGQPKFNLNYYVSNQDVNGLASVISSNLPSFSVVRKGGLSDDYNRTLAANIIGYADADSTPLVGANYRGVDSTPYVTILHDKHTLLSVSGSTANVEGWVYVQLWNPSNKQISGTFGLEFNNLDDLLVGVNSLQFQPSVVSGYPFTDRNITLGPNEVTVLEYGPITYAFNGGFGTPVPPFTRNAPTHTRTNFKTKWNGQDVDRTAGGMERRNGTLGLNSPKVTGGLPGLRYNPYSASPAPQPTGDPRVTYYLPKDVAQQSYEDRTAWWGMAVMRPLPNHYFTDPTTWTDPAPNTSVPYPSTNSSANLATGLTGALLQTYKTQATLTKTNEAPFIFSNSGSFQSATELGNVFDPALWSYTIPATNGIPSNAISGVNAGAGYGGGISLRIGRPEHPKFDIPGARASQLLDLLGVDPGATNQLVKPQLVSGKININTAGTNALRALVAGIQLQRDLAAGTNLPPMTGGVVGKWFADAVIARRSTAPFLSVAELCSVTNSLGKIFGNLNQWTSAKPPATFQDAALEELFAKMYDLTSVKSRSFRIIVVGQTLNEQGKVVATGTKEFQVVLNPQRDPAGAITNQSIQTFYEISY